MTDPSWLVGVFLLGPAVGLASVVAGVIVSSRVNDPRVAQQVGGVIIVPIVAITLLQATGTVLVGRTGYLLMTVIVLIVSVIGLRIGVRAVRSRGDPDALAVDADGVGAENLTSRDRFLPVGSGHWRPGDATVRVRRQVLVGMTTRRSNSALVLAYPRRPTAGIIRR